MAGFFGGKSSNDVVASTRNWYSERFENALVQRNVLLLMTLLAICFMIVGAFVVGQIAASRSIDPFVVELEPKTGLTTVVNPVTRKELSSQEALNRYFIMKYIRARETYNNATFDYNSNTVLRLFSNPRTWLDYRAYLSDAPDAPQKIYGNKTFTTLQLRSIVFDEANKATVRFRITENGSSSKEFNKIASIRFDYVTLSLDEEARLINPLGFQVTGYSVAPDSS